MTPWHTDHPHNEKILDNRSSATYQLRTTKHSVNTPPNHFYSAPYASDFGYPNPNTAHAKSDAYKPYFCSRNRAMARISSIDAGEGATSDTGRTLGRYRLQGGRI